MKKDAFDIIDTVHLTEKATLLAEKGNSYVFRVNRKATKPEIKRAVEEIFGKSVVRVNTAQVSGKAKRERRADYGRTAHWKKAVVTLKQGETINLA